MNKHPSPRPVPARHLPWLRLTVALILGATPAAAAAAPLPPPVRAMIEAAARSGRQDRIDAVVAVARETNPDATPEIDALVAQFESARATAREEELLSAGFFDEWSGSGEFGGSFATGNSDTVTLAVGINLSRDGIAWRHSFQALADLQRSQGVNSQERYALSYQGDWKISDRVYLLGRVGWERNRVAGLKSRFIQAVGAGYHMVLDSPVSWDLEGGPSLRQSDFYDREERAAALRLASNFNWDITTGTHFSQNTTVIFETDNNSLITATALTSRLWGPVSVRLSVSTQYESNPPDLARNFDTVTRGTLVYEFGRKAR